MPRFRTKGSSESILTWLGTLEMKPGDTLRLVRVSGLGTVGVAPIATWDEKRLTATSGDNFADLAMRMAQGDCNGLEQRQEYRLEHVHDGQIDASFTVRCEPTENAGLLPQYDDEDPSAAGQIRQQMAFSRQMLQFSMAAPMHALESLTQQLQIAQQRIVTLENERAAMLDTYAEALQLVAEANAAQAPTETVVQKAQAMMTLVPQVVQGVKLLQASFGKA